MKLYFGNYVTIITTVLLIGLIAFMIRSYVNKEHINYWGRRSLFVAVYGLVICCFAAARDGLDKTIQYAIDQSCKPGIFELISLPTIIGSVGATVILIVGVMSIFIHAQQKRKIMFFIISGSIAIKILTMEIARIIL